MSNVANEISQKARFDELKTMSQILNSKGIAECSLDTYVSVLAIEEDAALLQKVFDKPILFKARAHY